ncbi:hypothetical protein [Bacillus infantis]|uniref:hypothetical protein n=1 Tax=Bacillus infantis TaxID=324767 RepID=UPI003CF0B864
MEHRLNQVIGKVMEVTGMNYEYVLDEMTVGEMKEIYDDEMERLKFKEELMEGSLEFPKAWGVTKEEVYLCDSFKEIESVSDLLKLVDILSNKETF